MKSLVILVALLIGCGEASNFNQIFVSKEQDDALTTKYFLAQAAYDRGDFEEAIKLAEEAREISPNNEDVAILTGYIRLSLAGMDTFNLARGLVQASSSKKTSLLASSNNAASLFSTLKKVIGLSDDDLVALGTLENDQSLEYFKDYKVILPITVDKVAATDVEMVGHINKALETICPFVDPEVRLDKDDRHKDENCPQTSNQRFGRAKSHFLWAWLHLAEAVLYYSVVLYQEEGRDKANINLRADTMEANAATANLGLYVAHVRNLATSVNTIFDVAESKSMFNAILNNLEVVATSFIVIGNLPRKFKKSLDKAIASINEQKDTVAGASESQKEGNALKNQITEAMSGEVSNQISTIASENPEEFAENKTELCGAYTDISGGAALPDECN